MIYRVRSNKRSWEIKVTPKGNFLKLAFGKRVCYFELWNVFHTLISISDNPEFTFVKHFRLKYRKTVSRRYADLLGVY